MNRTTKSEGRRRTLRALIAAGAVATVVGATAMPAFANAPNPDPDTMGTSTVNADGSVTAHLSGTWTWSNQNCEGRYGEGYAVDWWGVSSSPTPNPSFSLTNATEVTSPGVTTTGTISPAGSIQLHNNTGYFHVPAFYSGEVVNSAATCTDTGPNSSVGSWSASATYPSAADIPPAVCVNMYDEHGNEGKPSGSSNDFSPVNDNDNSIQTNQFDPTMGMGYCVTLVPTNPTPTGAVGAIGLTGGLAIVGGGLFFFRRRRQARAVTL